MTYPYFGHAYCCPDGTVHVFIMKDVYGKDMPECSAQAIGNELLVCEHCNYTKKAFD